MGEKEFPVKIVLAFKDKASKEEWLGGYLDGWGEGAPFYTEWEGGKSADDVSELQVFRCSDIDGEEEEEEAD